MFLKRRILMRKQGMETKVIKEESVDKDGGGYIETPRSRSSKGSTKQERCKTPESPECGKQPTAPLSPSQSSPQRNNPSSPPNNGSNDSLTPPLPPTPSILSVSLDTARTSIYESQHSAPLCGFSSPRQLTKVKRFLSTLVQFGTDISTDVGDRVRSLVLNLVSSNLTIEEFHHSLQDVTNFPLRPFVLPFLRTHLPILQREVHALARVNKQSTLQYVRSHDHLILEATQSPSEAAEIFMPNDITPLIGTKRRFSDGPYENGVNGQQQPTDTTEYPPTKRPFQFGYQAGFLLPNVATTGSNPSNHAFDYSTHNNQHTQKINNEESRMGEDEWKNIHVMLNCILSMVEKTKRALTILQQRNNQDATTDWLRKQDVSLDLKKAANEILAQAVRQTEDRVAEVRRRAEDAVNDVKRQAVIELQKAVAAAETKANELIAAERAKMEKMLIEAKKHTEDASHQSESATTDSNNHSPSSQPAPSQQNACWNCGRRAHETCSGCGVARYCGAFCQHKDWENHHQACPKEKQRSKDWEKDKDKAGRPPPAPAAPARQPPPATADVKFKK